MNQSRIAAVVLIVGGVLALLYGTFSFTKETHRAQVGPVELTVKDRETVNIPAWVGVGAVLAGGLLLVVQRRKQ